MIIKKYLQRYKFDGGFILFVTFSEFEMLLIFLNGFQVKAFIRQEN